MTDDIDWQLVLTLAAVFFAGGLFTRIMMHYGW